MVSSVEQNRTLYPAIKEALSKSMPRLAIASTDCLEDKPCPVLFTVFIEFITLSSLLNLHWPAHPRDFAMLPFT